jgi:hypothetical protein
VSITQNFEANFYIKETNKINSSMNSVEILSSFLSCDIVYKWICLFSMAPFGFMILEACYCIGLNINTT